MFIIKILKHTLMISSFVFIMMLLIEYLSVKSRGKWEKSLKKVRLYQYILSAFLGAFPGCLGAFSVVSLYSHRVVSFGALVTSMIATSGDESFLMFSMFPVKAMFITIGLFFIGIFFGYITDLFYEDQDKLIDHLKYKYPIHADDICKCYPKGEIFKQFRNISLQRVIFILIFITFLFLLFSGLIGPMIWDWKKITFTLGTLFTLFVVSTVPDHFLEDHFWDHVLKKHLPKIFLWTFGALFFIHLIETQLDLTSLIKNNKFVILLIALLVGIIPESGPHMIFVTLFAAGSLPVSILIASSIVQDGHGMLPMLAVSKKGFIKVKLINMGVGLIAGLIGIFFSF